MPTEGLRQVLLFLGLAIAICAVVLYAYTRCPRSTLLLLACSSIAVVWLLSLPIHTKSSIRRDGGRCRVIALRLG